MNVLIAYDIDKRHTEVKTALLARGFLDHWFLENQQNLKINLPNTTLWKSCGILSEAKDTFMDIITQLNRNEPPSNQINVQRFISVVFTSTNSIPGEPHAK